MKIRIGYLINGSKNHERQAREAMPILVLHAKAHATLFYGDLARELQMANPRHLNHVLGTIGHSLEELGRRWGQRVPPIEALVCNKATEMPGDGVQGFLPAGFAKHAVAQRRQILKNVLWEVFNYPRWDAVLGEFRLQPAVGPSLLPPPRRPTRRHHGEESQEHKDLKQYVSTHPQIVGVSARRAPGSVEFEFPSADCVDVLFKAKTRWTGVEVKPADAPDEEIQRGLFQCVKYTALIEAMQSAELRPRDARVVLCLGGRFPSRLSRLRGILGIEVLEGMTSRLAQ